MIYHHSLSMSLSLTFLIFNLQKYARYMLMKFRLILNNKSGGWGAPNLNIGGEFKHWLTVSSKLANQLSVLGLTCRHARSFSPQPYRVRPSRSAELNLPACLKIISSSSVKVLHISLNSLAGQRCRFGLPASDEDGWLRLRLSD